MCVLAKQLHILLNDKHFLITPIVCTGDFLMTGHKLKENIIYLLGIVVGPAHQVLQQIPTTFLFGMTGLMFLLPMPTAIALPYEKALLEHRLLRGEVQQMHSLEAVLQI